MQKWLEVISDRFKGQPLVKEKIDRQIDYLTKEKEKGALWIIDDSNGNISVLKSEFSDAINLELYVTKYYREDEFTSIADRKVQGSFDDERPDFEYAKCIVISCMQGLDGPAGHVIRNIFNLALDAASDRRSYPKIAFIGANKDRCDSFWNELQLKWDFQVLPFLFLFNTKNRVELRAQKAKVKKFFSTAEPDEEGDIDIKIPSGYVELGTADDQVLAKEGVAPSELEPIVASPPGDQHSPKETLVPANPSADTSGVKPLPAENDLVIVVGGKITAEGDLGRFNALKEALGQDNSLAIIDPWDDGGEELTLHSDLQAKFDTAKNPLLIEHVGEKDLEDKATAFEDYLHLCSLRPLGLLKSLVARASERRLLWKPDSTRSRRQDGVEINNDTPKDFALLVRRRAGLEKAESPKAFVAVEEVIVDGKLDTKLRKALKRHLSLLVGGNGEPPEDECVVPFSFQVAGTDDPLYEAALNFGRRPQKNIVATCDVSRGTRRLEDYLTSITARIRDGVAKGFRDKGDLFPDRILHILVMIEGKRLDTELTDRANGNWRVVKFRQEAGEYQPDERAFNGAKAWMKAQLDA
ncbi:hypothetical protein CK230_21960 [Mesorhizobium sp. WSM3859]|nr:hypothetical protein CK230_21960 [Mesorhizobium sp. WSM3859]